MFRFLKRVFKKPELKKPMITGSFIGSFEEAMVWHNSYKDVCLSERY